MDLKKENGFALTDTIIAIAIIVIFTGLVISISYNIYVGSNFIKRNDTATNYIVDLFEHAKNIDFDNVNEDSLIKYINDKNDGLIKAGKYLENLTKSTPFTMLIEVDDSFNEKNYEDFIKKIDVTVFYKLGNKQKEVNMSTLINK